MSGLGKLAKKYAKILEQLPDDRQKLALIMAADAHALTANRIQNTGVDANDTKMKLYSRKPLPYWKLNESDFNAPSKIKKFKADAAKKKIEPTYENLRKSYGLPINKRTLTFDGDMWKSIEQVVTNHDQLITEVTIRAKDKVNQNKINSNSRIVGINILQFSEDEQEFIRESNEKRIKELLK
jgi:hypothetical protein